MDRWKEEIMNIIKITPEKNGAHQNQNSSSLRTIPTGWAEIPVDMKIPSTFPFVNIEVEGQIVTKMTAGVVPEPEPQPTPPPTEEERLSALESAMLAMMEG